ATFARIRQSRAEALMIVPDALFIALRARIAELALRNRLPFVAAHPFEAEAGAVLVYSYNTGHISRLAATYVDRRLKGAKSADLPGQEPTIIELIINRKTAKAL